MQTDPSIPFVIDAQRSAAIEAGAAFFNLFEAMGGEGSMIEWVEGDTTYANKDYTHFNHRGAARASVLIRNFLFEELEKYEQTAEEQ